MSISRGFRMPEEVYSKLQKVAKERGYLNVSEYLREIVRNELEKEA